MPLYRFGFLHLYLMRPFRLVGWIFCWWLNYFNYLLYSGFFG